MTDHQQINKHTIACKQLARLAMVKSGINAKTVADALAKDTSTLSRYLSPDHEHEMGITGLLIFEALTGDRTVLDYLLRELGEERLECAS